MAELNHTTDETSADREQVCCAGWAANYNFSAENIARKTGESRHFLLNEVPQ